MKFLFLSFLIIILFSCKNTDSKIFNIKTEDISKQIKPVSINIDSEGMNIVERFQPPSGYIRLGKSENSFAYFLRNIPLLDRDQKVYLYNGHQKPNQSVHASIFDIDFGNRDLQQCADAVMRLRAEYLYKEKKYNEIAFNFTNGWKFEYSKWRIGNKLVVKGNRTFWKPGNSPKDSYVDFRKYMDQVFMYAGTLSLDKEMKSRPIDQLQIGDVFIKGGSPGHAVLVVDVSENRSTGEKAFYASTKLYASSADSYS